jgi:hypothetical protein
MSKIIGCMDCCRQHPNGDIPCDNCPATHPGSGRWWCRHRTAFANDHKQCRCGIDFRQWGVPIRACVGESKDCERYSPMSKLEWFQREQEHNARFARVGQIRKAIVEHFEASGESCGQITCPCCEGGSVSYSRSSYNGHIHARCSTPNCANWVE